MTTPNDRLEALNLVLPVPATPVANYVSFVRTGTLIHISGQISRDASGGGYFGKVGEDVSIEDAVKAAKLCGLNLLAQMKAATGDLSHVVRVIKLNVFVQAGKDFHDIPTIANGASDLMVDVLGEAGKHARSAVGVYCLPLNCAVEIDALIDVVDLRR